MDRALRTLRIASTVSALVALNACAPADDLEEERTTLEEVTCGPTMRVFPVRGAHNIGYDAASCGTGTCATTCPDAHANSDYGGAHHGIDLFAHRGAELVAVTDGVITRTGWTSPTSGQRVRLRDRCGWEYYYGHMDAIFVSVGQHVTAGQVIGTMGSTGAASVHTHFNVSPDGNYYSDINPFDLLRNTSATACGAAPAPTPAPPPPRSGCGILGPGGVLGRGERVRSCDGRFDFVHQTDGNVVLYQGSRALWHTHTNGRATSALVMQDDGNLVLYAPGGVPLWHTHTDGRRGAWLTMQNDGNAVLYVGTSPVWASNTAGH